MADADRELDLRGLNCPLPVLRTAKALRAMTPGGLLRVLATDPMAAIDVPHFCNENGHRLVSRETSDGRMVFVIRSGG